MGYSPWGHKKSDITERLTFSPYPAIPFGNRKFVCYVCESVSAL